MESIVFRYRTYKPPLKHVQPSSATLKEKKDTDNKTESKSKPDESPKNPIYVR